MGVLETILIILEAICSIALIAVVLLQSGKEAGLSGALAGASDSYLSKNKKVWQCVLFLALKHLKKKLIQLLFTQLHRKSGCGNLHCLRTHASCRICGQQFPCP